jgi:hypothetical protein
LTPSTSYQRLLVHRCSAYYGLAPESEHGSKFIYVCNTVDSKMCFSCYSSRLLPLMAYLLDHLEGYQSSFHKRLRRILPSRLCVVHSSMNLVAQRLHRRQLRPPVKRPTCQTTIHPRPAAWAVGVTSAALQQGRQGPSKNEKPPTKRLVPVFLWTLKKSQKA